MEPEPLRAPQPEPPGRAMIGPGRLSLNQATVQHADAAEAIDLCVRHDIPAHRPVAATRSPRLGLAADCRDGRGRPGCMCPACAGAASSRTRTRTPGPRPHADNRAAVAEAAALGADALILVSGGLMPGSRDLGLARRMIADAIGELAPVAPDAGVRLGHRGAASDVLRRPLRDLPARPGASTWPAVPRRRGRRRGRHLPRVVGRARSRPTSPARPADRELPAVRLDPAAAGRHAARPRPPW